MDIAREVNEFSETDIAKIEDFDTVMQAYVFLCLAELREFFRVSENKKEFNEVVDVTKEKMINDFCRIFGGDDIEKYARKTLTFFDEIEGEMNDPRDLWYNQAIYFGKLLSSDKIDFAKLTEENLGTKLGLSLTTQEVQIENAKMFQKVILGREIK